MLKITWKAAFRSLGKNKFYTFISLFGLAAGLTAAIGILLWCQDERNYNQSVKNAENVYRAIPNFVTNGNKGYFPTVPPALAYVSKQVPGIERVGRIYPNRNEMVLRYKERSFAGKHSAFIDPALFDILDLPFTKGNRTTPFQNNRCIVLAEPYAKKYFGDENPLDKLITRQDKKETYRVTGVVKLPHNPQTNYDYFLPMSILDEGNRDSTRNIDRDWLDYDFEQYVRLDPGTSTASVAANLTKAQKANTSDELTKTINYSLQPLAKIHLYNPDGTDGQITMVRIFTWVALVILLIASINYINLAILQVAANTTMNDWPGKDPGKTFLISTIPIASDFLSTMHIQLLAGQGFTNTPADSGHYLLNESAIREMGLKDPIGKPFTLYDKKGIIAGIVHDFHFKDMHQKIGPCVLMCRPDWIGQIYVRTTGGHATEAIAAAERLWKVYNQDYPFEFNFLDDAYYKLYTTDQRTGSLFKVFAFIAIFISCLGLFALMTYTAQLKTKEIGIRKVLGATILSVTGLLAKDFIRLILIAIVIASPIGWYSMNRWLQDFAYRTAISWWIFPVAGIGALLIAVATISFQAIKAALANPVQSLRTE